MAMIYLSTVCRWEVGENKANIYLQVQQQCVYITNLLLRNPVSHCGYNIIIHCSKLSLLLALNLPGCRSKE